MSSGFDVDEFVKRHMQELILENNQSDNPTGYLNTWVQTTRELLNTYKIDCNGSDPEKIVDGSIQLLQNRTINGHYNILQGWAIIETIGDGTCGIHAFLHALSPFYRIANEVCKRYLGQIFRKTVFANLFTDNDDQVRINDVSTYLTTDDLQKLCDFLLVNALFVVPRQNSNELDFLCLTANRPPNSTLGFQGCLDANTYPWICIVKMGQSGPSEHFSSMGFQRQMNGQIEYTLSKEDDFNPLKRLQLSSVTASPPSDVSNEFNLLATVNQLLGLQHPTTSATTTGFDLLQEVSYLFKLTTRSSLTEKQYSLLDEINILFGLQPRIANKKKSPRPRNIGRRPTKVAIDIDTDAILGLAASIAANVLAQLEQLQNTMAEKKTTEAKAKRDASKPSAPQVMSIGISSVVVKPNGDILPETQDAPPQSIVLV